MPHTSVGGAVTTEEVHCRTCGHVQRRTPDPSSWRCPQHPEIALVSAATLERAGRAPLLGHVLGGKYHLIDVLGRGGFGAVYRALQAPVGRTVAVKVIGGRHADDQEDLRARFMREARAIASLRHHATVALHDFGEDGDTLYMVLEVVEGETLRDVLKREGRLPVHRAVHIARQVLEALQEAHAQGLVHRDLKPSNVMLSLTPFGDDKVKVLDFGIAKIVEAERSDGVETSKGMVYGSPAYMAPEQAQARAEPRSDLYAVGVMLYEMLT
ncbi:MAG: serine/threonine protein kinase, partial [Myxococcales bacterium]|nr:serine/threonine protein kinase [Myxococcales bacterium]